MTTTINDLNATVEAPRLKVNKVDSEASMRWLNAGIKDFKAAPLASMTYGMIYVVLGLVLACLLYTSRCV